MRPENEPEPVQARWAAMALFLAGEPVPALPDLPGRHCRGGRDDTHDELRQQWDREQRKLKPGWWGSLP